LSLRRCIAISVLFHIMLLWGIWTVPSMTRSRVQVFNVDLVEPREARKPPAPAKRKPVLEKKTRRPPVIVKPRSPAGGKKPLPGAAHGRGTEPPQKDTEETETAPPPPQRAPLSSLFDRKTIEKFARKGLPPGNGLSFDTSVFRYRRYMRTLKERIEGIWKYPEEAGRRGISGDLYMDFTIKKDGTLGEIEIVRTSGYRELDEAAIKALRDAAPFWPLPDDWDKDSLKIRGHFIYILGRTYIM